LAGAAQKLIDFREPRPQLIFLELQQTFARLSCIALAFKVGSLLLEAEVLGFALQLFGRRTFDLRNEGMHPFIHFDK
jgi:hypothetical protein